MEKKEIKSFVEYSEDKFTKRVIYKNGGSVAFVLNFMPGQELPPHKHPDSALFILVLEGSGTVNVDDVQSVLVKDDIISVDGDELFSFKNTTNDPVSLYAVLSKSPGEQYTKNV